MSYSKRLGRILVTNDDGIDAPGLAVAAEVAAELADEVWVSAPAQDCSGRSRAVSLHDPLRVTRRGPRMVAVHGSPADSVIVGIRHLMRANPPELVVSGVNAGANLSKEVHYSGTVGAALTACLLGTPAVALSQAWITRSDLPWDTSREWLPRVVGQLLDGGEWPHDVIYNINVPNVPASMVTGVEASRLSMGYRVDIDVDRRIDHRDVEYFWVEFSRQRAVEPDGTDLDVILRNAVSVTPIALDQTAHGHAEALNARL